MTLWISCFPDGLRQLIKQTKPTRMFMYGGGEKMGHKAWSYGHKIAKS